MAGSVVLGTLKYILGLDSVAFKKGMTEAERELVVAQKRMIKQGEKLQSLGKNMSTFITLPLVGLAAKGIKEAQETAQAMAQVDAALKSMGPVANRTREQLIKAADAMEMKSLFEGDQILRKVTANLLTFGNISGEMFDRAQQSAVDLATRLGTDLQSATILVGKALNDPIKGMGALSKAGIQFSAEQKKQIKAFVEGGQAAKAQALIMKELERQFKGSAEAAQNVDPLNKLNDAFKQMAEKIGTVLLPLIPKVTDAIVKLLDGFNNLSPETQKWIGIIAGVAAALGPFAFILGTLMKVLGPVLPLLAQLGPASAGIGAGATAGAGGITALAGALLPIAALVGGVYLAYKNWDKIGPYIDGVVSRTKKFVTETDASLKTFQDKIDQIDKDLGVPSKQEFFDSIGKSISENWAKLNSFDLQKWADAADASIVSFASRAWKSFEDLWNRAKASFAGVEAAARTYLVDKFNVIVTSIKQKVDQVIGFFRTMWEKVVGHSYVPDMVDEIGVQMAKLQSKLVEPAQKGAKAAAAAFKELQSNVSAVLERLFPEQVRSQQFLTELKLLEDGMKKVGFTADQTGTALARLHAEYANEILGPEALPDWLTSQDYQPPDKMEIDYQGIEVWSDKVMGINDNLRKDAKLTSQQIIEAYGQMAVGVLDSIRGLASSLKHGDFLGVLESILNLVGGVVSTLMNIGVIKGGTSSITPRAGGGPVVPGRTYLVGENGPEYARFGSRGYITPPKGGPQQKVLIIPSPYFDAVVDQRSGAVAAPMAGQAAVAGAIGGASAVSRRAKRNFYGGAR